MNGYSQVGNRTLAQINACNKQRFADAKGSVGSEFDVGDRVRIKYHIPGRNEAEFITGSEVKVTAVSRWAGSKGFRYQLNRGPWVDPDMIEKA